MSASVTSDRANLRKRGTMLGYIFANQGWGSLVGSLATIVVLACYKHVMEGEGETEENGKNGEKDCSHSQSDQALLAPLWHFFDRLLTKKKTGGTHDRLSPCCTKVIKGDLIAPSS